MPIYAEQLISEDVAEGGSEFLPRAVPRILVLPVRLGDAA